MKNEGQQHWTSGTKTAFSTACSIGLICNFKGLEEMGELLTEPRALREGYLEQLLLHTEGLKKMCRGMNIDFTRMNSGDPLDVALSSFLAVREASIK